MKRTSPWRRRRLTTETLEPRCMLSATTVVGGYSFDVSTGDLDNSGDLSVGDMVTSDGVSLIYGDDAFDGIQAAIDATDPGGTVQIAPGDYHETLEINKDLTVTRTPGTSDPVVVHGLGIGEHAVTITITDANVLIEDLTVTESFLAVGTFADATVALSGVEITGNVFGVEVNSGSITLTGCSIYDVNEGVTIYGGLATITQTTIDCDDLGILIKTDGSALLRDNPDGIAAGRFGVDVNGGTLMAETTNFNGSPAAIIIRSPAMFDNSTVDLGQLPGGVDFTGLGISSGGNDFSGYTGPSFFDVGAIINVNLDSDFFATPGPLGLPPLGTDTPAFNNIWFSNHPFDIETVIFHDGDAVFGNMEGFVDYAVLSDLELAMTDVSVDEGSLATLTGSFVNDPQPHTVLIEWGDGETETLSLLQDAFTFDIEHTYADDSDYMVTVTVTDKLGDSLGATSAAPTIAAMNVGTGNEGDLLNLNAAATDLDDNTLAYAWSFGDGDQAVGQNVEHAYVDNGDYTVTLTVTDAFGNVATQTAVASVANVAPTVAILAVPAEGQERVPVDLTASVTDPGTADTFTYAWSVTKDGAAYADGTDAAFTFTPDDNGFYVVTLTVSDGDDTGTDFIEIDISNEPPVVTVDNASVTANEGTTVTNAGTYSDVDLDPVTLTASIGTVTKTGDSGGTWTWTFDATDGPLTDTVTITADDQQGGVATTTFNLNVDNVAPALDDTIVAVEENSPNGTLVGTVEGTDPGDDTLTYSIVGGDGATAFAIDPATGEITVADQTQLDYEYTTAYTLEVQVADEDGGVDTATVTVDLINRASIDGAVFIDVNENGLYDANEPAVDAVIIELLDEFGTPVLDGEGTPITAVTDGGYYLFEDLPAGTYQIRENQITGLDDGPELLGTLGGSLPANDVMQVTLATTDAQDYIFAEIGQQVAAGDTANVGFWNSRHGRNLIVAGGTDLAQWLTTNFSNVFGDSLDGADGQDVYTFFRDELFRQRGILSRLLNRVDTEFVALTLATYFTSSDLAGDLGTGYGFNVTQTGIGTKVVNVGILGDAFGVANNTNMTIWQILQATNSMTDIPDNQSGFAHTYDLDGNGSINLNELVLRLEAYLMFRSILGDG